MTKVLGVRKVKISILVVKSHSVGWNNGMLTDEGANTFIYSSKIRSHECVYVCIMWEKCGCVCGWGGVGMLKFRVDDLHAPSSWLLGRVKRHGRLLQPSWPQSPLYTMSLCYLPTLWSASAPSHIQTHTHRERPNKVFDLHGKMSHFGWWCLTCEMVFVEIYG